MATLDPETIAWGKRIGISRERLEFLAACPKYTRTGRNDKPAYIKTENPNHHLQKLGSCWWLRIRRRKTDIIHNLGVGGRDSFGQEVPVYSFCGNYTMVVQSAEWCGPCQQLASMIPDELETIRGEFPNFTFYEVLYQNNRGSLPNERVLSNWRDNFELAGVPVVAPADNMAAEMNWINASGGIPATLLLAPDMTVIWSGINHPGEYYLTDARDILRAIRQYENGN